MYVAAKNASFTVLKKRCRTIFRLSFMEGRRNPEIANELGITLQTVKNQKVKAIK